MFIKRIGIAGVTLSPFAVGLFASKNQKSVETVENAVTIHTDIVNILAI